MQVAAIHRIRDRDNFHRVVGDAMEAGPPEGFALPHQFNSDDGTTQICIWEAPSVDAVRELVDGTVGEFADNEVFAVEAVSAG